jgi:hypothetical protein
MERVDGATSKRLRSALPAQSDERTAFRKFWLVLDSVSILEMQLVKLPPHDQKLIHRFAASATQGTRRPEGAVRPLIAAGCLPVGQRM